MTINSKKTLRSVVRKTLDEKNTDLYLDSKMFKFGVFDDNVEHRIDFDDNVISSSELTKVVNFTLQMWILVTNGRLSEREFSETHLSDAMAGAEKLQNSNLSTETLVELCGTDMPKNLADSLFKHITNNRLYVYSEPDIVAVDLAYENLVKLFWFEKFKSGCSKNIVDSALKHPLKDIYIDDDTEKSINLCVNKTIREIKQHGKLIFPSESIKASAKSSKVSDYGYDAITENSIYWLNCSKAEPTSIDGITIIAAYLMMLYDSINGQKRFGSIKNLVIYNSRLNSKRVIEVSSLLSDIQRIELIMFDIAGYSDDDVFRLTRRIPELKSEIDAYQDNDFTHLLRMSNQGKSLNKKKSKEKRKETRSIKKNVTNNGDTTAQVNKPKKQANKRKKESDTKKEESINETYNPIVFDVDDVLANLDCDITSDTTNNDIVDEIAKQLIDGYGFNLPKSCITEYDYDDNFHYLDGANPFRRKKTASNEEMENKESITPISSKNLICFLTSLINTDVDIDKLIKLYADTIYFGYCNYYALDYDAKNKDYGFKIPDKFSYNFIKGLFKEAAKMLDGDIDGYEAYRKLKWFVQFVDIYEIKEVRPLYKLKKYKLNNETLQSCLQHANDINNFISNILGDEIEKMDSILDMYFGKDDKYSVRLKIDILTASHAINCHLSNQLRNSNTQRDIATDVFTTTLFNKYILDNSKIESVSLFPRQHSYVIA